MMQFPIPLEPVRGSEKDKVFALSFLLHFDAVSWIS